MGTSAYYVYAKPFLEAKTNLVGAVQEISVMVVCIPLFPMYARKARDAMAMMTIYLIMIAIILTACIEVIATIISSRKKLCPKGKPSE